MNGNILAKMRLVNDFRNENRSLKFDLSDIKSAMGKCLNKIEDIKRREASGQWALFGMKDGKYFCQGVFDIDSEDISDEVMGETLMILPLPKHDTLTEFDGF